MPLSSGQILNNRYRIVKLLGQGGFGAVYKAWDMTFELQCAVKENIEVSPEAQRQFEREAKLLRVLRYANLPEVSDFFFLPGIGQYLVMDYIEGEDLQDVVAKSSRGLPETQAVPWTLQICAVLEYLHNRAPAVIHRDIKPKNIRITPDGQAYLVDFGIAKQYDPSRPTTTGARAATPGYAPIEQYKQSGTDARSDIYSLGACLYYMVTGHQPPECLDLLTGGVLVLPRQLNPPLDQRVEQAILKAMQMDPKQRFQSASEMAAALNLPQSAARTPAQASPYASPVPATVQSPAQAAPYASPIPATVLAPAPIIPIDRFTLNLAPGVDMVFVRVPAGEFWMGSDPKIDLEAKKDETPRHKVYLDEYWIGLYPVTNAQFQVFLVDSGYAWGKNIPNGKLDYPVVKVIWKDAQKFCIWASQRCGVEVRLPAEAEGEKAARGPDGRIYPWGNQAPDPSMANFIPGSGGPCPVGSHPAGASPYGAQDMAGNVWEWVQDWYSGFYYANSPASNPPGPSFGNYRVLRGGAWGNVSRNVRAALRTWGYPVNRNVNCGFRCSR
jgi:formylglycine-generating enzyme required for sulfatase activity/predicted Ser/Thr protein kinase